MDSCCATWVSLALAETARPTQIAQAASSGMNTSAAGSCGACHTAAATAGPAASCVIEEPEHLAAGDAERYIGNGGRPP